VNITLTPEGGLRIDVMDAGEWHLLSSMADDASDRDTHLSEHLGSLIEEEAIAEDWREFVTPDLAAAFDADLAAIAAAVERAREAAAEKTGSLVISPNEGPRWYGVLNQARLALEERYHFGPGESPPAHLTPPARAAFFRSRFYCAIQSVLLEHLM
jgi:hypothetical protein